jgi:hypothetical protein
MSCSPNASSIWGTTAATSWPLTLTNDLSAYLRTKARVPFVGLLCNVALWPYLVITKCMIEPVLAAEGRKYEYAADKAAVNAGYGPGLSRALEQLRPFERARSGWEDVLYAAHPPLEYRLEAIDDLLSEQRQRAAPAVAAAGGQPPPPGISPTPPPSAPPKGSGPPPEGGTGSPRPSPQPQPGAASTSEAGATPVRAADVGGATEGSTLWPTVPDVISGGQTPSWEHPGTLGINAGNLDQANPYQLPGSRRPLKRPGSVPRLRPPAAPKKDPPEEGEGK